MANLLPADDVRGYGRIILAQKKKDETEEQRQENQFKHLRIQNNAIKSTSSRTSV